MLRKIRQHLTYANVMSTIACFGIFASGTAYAANTVFSTDIVDGEVKSADIRDVNVTNAKLANLSVGNAKIRADAVDGSKIAGDAVGSSEVAPESLTSADLATDSVNATEVADNSIDAGEIVDFGLSNQDVGVLFAQINADGSVFNSSGGVTGTKIGTGTYEVDFGIDVSNCASVVTQGEGSVGGAVGGMAGVTDRSGNADAFFVTMRTDANALADRSFQEIVVC